MVEIEMEKSQHAQSENENIPEKDYQNKQKHKNRLDYTCTDHTYCIQVT